MIIRFGTQMTITIHLHKLNDGGYEVDVRGKYKTVETARC